MLKFFTPQNQTLLRQLVITDFKLRYQGSVLGYVWSLLKPLMLFTVLYLVFTYVLPLGKGVPHFAAYLLLGVVMWNFFVEGTTMGMGSIVGRGDLIRKVQISKPAIVIASTLSAAVNFGLSLIIVGIFMFFNHAEVSAMVVFLPLVLLELLALVLALSFFLSALYVRFRDIAQIWEVILQIMFYATPIIYALQYVQPHKNLLVLISLNPIAQIIQDAREMLITTYTLTTHEVLGWVLGVGIPLVFLALLSIFSIWFFKKSSKTFAENL